MAMETPFPDEIFLYEILSRIPAKSLLQLRSVSKTWCTSISSDPYFTKSHFHHWKTKQPGLIKQPCDEHYNYHDSQTGEIYDLKLNQILNDKNSLIPFTSSYGLLIIQSLDWSNTHSIPFFYVCNPITRQFTRLPPAPHWLNPCEIGFDVVTQRYKVVSWSNTKGCVVFTLGDVVVGKDKSCWRVVPLPLSISDFYSRPVLAYGAFYWVSITVSKLVSYTMITSLDSCVLCLDISTEKMKKIDVPQEKYDKPPVLVEIGEVLYAVFNSEKSSLEELVVWVLLDEWGKITWRKIGRCCGSGSLFEAVREIVGRDRLLLHNGIMPVREKKKGYRYCLDHVNTLVSWDGKAFDKKRKWYQRGAFKFVFFALFYLLVFYYFVE